MIVNESGLLSAMKDSYKIGGYHVAVGEVFGKKCYLITSGSYSWAAVIRHAKMSRKILGLLAEHIGRLPEDGEAFLCKQKDEAQGEMLDVTIEPILQKLVERCLYVEGQLSYVYIHHTVPGEAEKNIVAQLGRAIWT